MAVRVEGSMLLEPTFLSTVNVKLEAIPAGAAVTWIGTCWPGRTSVPVAGVMSSFGVIVGPRVYPSGMGAKPLKHGSSGDTAGGEIVTEPEKYRRGLTKGASW